jgi:hypothetical protein
VDNLLMAMLASWTVRLIIIYSGCGQTVYYKAPNIYNR